MRTVNECPKGIGLVSNFLNFLGEKKNVTDFLIDVNFEKLMLDIVFLLYLLHL